MDSIAKKIARRNENNKTIGQGVISVVPVPAPAKKENKLVTKKKRGRPRKVVVDDIHN